MKISNPRQTKKSRIGKRAVEPGPSSSPWTESIIPVAIFLLAFSVRLVYLFQIEAIPLFYNLASDGRAYDEWAQRIAAGDWLGRAVFYQAPLYPYFLGLLQLMFGRDLWSIRVVQIILGAASCAMLYWAGRSLFSRGVGIAAGLILALYAPAVFFDALLQKTVLDLFLITALLALLGWAREKPRWALWGVVGAVLALLGLTRENALIWIFALPLWIWFYFAEHERRARLGWMGIFLAGLLLVLFPVGLRNRSIGGEFLLTTSQLGPNFFIGNNPAADGTYVPLRGGHGDPQFERQDATELAEQALGRRLSPGEVSDYWLRRSWHYIRTEPLDWLRLMGRKWMILWNVRELEDAEDFYLYQRWSWLLRGLGWAGHFGVLAPLAGLGLALTWRRWRDIWLLHLLLATLALSIALFYVFARYRLPMIPFLALYAGAGLVEGYALCQERSVRRWLVCALVLLLTGTVVHWPVTGTPAPSAAGHSNLANALVKQGRFDEAIENYRQALRVEPNFAVPHYSLGNLFMAQGKLDEAARHYLEAVRIDPDYAEAHNNLGNLLARRGELGNAIRYYRRALELSPARSEIHFNLGNVLVGAGALEQAAEHLQQAVKINPDYAEAYHNLGRVRAAQGDLNEAIVQFRRAVRVRPEFAEAHESLGRALAQQGNKAEAAQHYQEALRIMKSGRERTVSQ